MNMPKRENNHDEGVRKRPRTEQQWDDKYYHEEEQVEEQDSYWLNRQACPVGDWRRKPPLPRVGVLKSFAADTWAVGDVHRPRKQPMVFGHVPPSRRAAGPKTRHCLPPLCDWNHKGYPPHAPWFPGRNNAASDTNLLPTYMMTPVPTEKNKNNPSISGWTSALPGSSHLQHVPGSPLGDFNCAQDIYYPSSGHHFCQTPTSPVGVLPSLDDIAEAVSERLSKRLRPLLDVSLASASATSSSTETPSGKASSSDG